MGFFFLYSFEAEMILFSKTVFRVIWGDERGDLESYTEESRKKKEKTDGRHRASYLTTFYPRGSVSTIVFQYSF